MIPEAALLAGALACFSTVALDRFLGERNQARLTQEDKANLTDAVSKRRSLATYISISIMLLVLPIGFANPRAFLVAFPVAVALIVVVLLTSQVAILRRLSELGLPADCVDRFRVQSTLVQIGSVAALLLFAYGIVAILT